LGEHADAIRQKIVKAQNLNGEELAGAHSAIEG